MARIRRKRYWYGIVKRMVQIYPEIKEEHTPQAHAFEIAIEEALEETLALPNGDSRIKAINMIYFSGTYSLDGAAMILGYSRRTIQRWCSSYIYLVAKKTGYCA